MRVSRSYRYQPRAVDIQFGKYIAQVPTHSRFIDKQAYSNTLDPGTLGQLLQYFCLSAT